MTRRILGLLACMAAVLSLAACTPAGRAVGDTQDSMPEVAHDSTHPTDVTVGFVGSTDTAADEFVINALSDDKLNVYYASLETSASSANATDGVSGETESSDAGTTSENGADSMDAHTGVDKNAVTAQQGVADFVARAVKIVVISGIDVTDANRESWNQTLTNAREAGIPVALIDPKHAPEDELLYAVILHLNTNSADSGDTAGTKPMTITDAVLTITRDEPHEREIKVTVS